MDRQYYQLIVDAIDITRLATAVVQNADYKPQIKAATDPLLIDATKTLQYTRDLLLEILDRQTDANTNTSRQ